MTGPHQGQPVLAAGVPLEKAKAVMIAVHGRGAGPRDILGLAQQFQQPDFAFLAPTAHKYTWYPYSFLAPIQDNEPGISSGIQALSDLVAYVGEQGFLPDSVMLMGFSQGACLSLEYAARNAQHFGGVVAFSGGLIGPEGTPRDYAGSMAETPVFIGCSDVDFHIPVERVRESATVMRGLGATVDERIYPGMGHTTNQDEIDAVRAMMTAMLQDES
jgi:predicted esterase